MLAVDMGQRGARNQGERVGLGRPVKVKSAVKGQRGLD